MKKTSFAGLTALSPGESLAEDGYAFSSRDRDVIDHFLEIGVVSHRHDERLALLNPAAPASATALSSGGALRADEEFYITYTLIDENNGETLPADAVVASMPSTIASPLVAPSAVADYTDGILPANTYYYQVTVLDNGGGETLASPWVQVDRSPGYASGNIQLTGLADIVAAASGEAWALYKSTGGGTMAFLEQGTASAYVDAGFYPVDASRVPPDTNTTNGDNALEITVPSAAMTDSNGRVADGFRIYVSRDGTFASPALEGAYPSASAGTAILVDLFLPEDGSPPDVSTCVRGASKIDPDEELLDWHWKRPVAGSAELPLTGNEEGDVRVTIDTGVFWSWTDGAWSGVEFSSEDSHLGEVTASASGTATNVESIYFIGSGGTTVDVSQEGSSAVVIVEGGDPVGTASLSALIDENGKGFMYHDDSQYAGRPSGFASVEWIGSVEPLAALNHDTLKKVAPPPPISFPLTGVLDSFDRADEGPPPGSGWLGQMHSTPIDGEGVYVTGSAIAPSGVGEVSSVYWNTEQFTAPCEVWATVQDVDDASYIALGMCVTAYDTEFTGYLASFSTNSDAWSLSYYEGNIAVATLAIANLVLGEGDKVGMAHTGDRIYVFHYDADTTEWSQINTVGTTHAASGSVGIELFQDFFPAGAMKASEFGGGERP